MSWSPSIEVLGHFARFFALAGSIIVRNLAQVCKVDRSGGLAMEQFFCDVGRPGVRYPATVVTGCNCYKHTSVQLNVGKNNSDGILVWK